MSKEVELTGKVCTFKAPAGTPVGCPARMPLIFAVKSGDSDGPHGVPSKMAKTIFHECTHKQPCSFKRDATVKVVAQIAEASDSSD